MEVQMPPTPAYVIDEYKLRQNLSLIKDVSQSSGAEIILAFKAFAQWRLFPIFKEYIRSTTASSINEVLLAIDAFGSKPHTYSPAYTDDEIDQIASCSGHLTFNSLGQFASFSRRALAINPAISLGLRINPEYSEVGTDLYNPCSPGTRFGVTADKLPLILPEGLEGFHCHCHCESGSDVFARTLQHIEKRFSPWFPYLKWINFGGGHLMTRKDYDTDLLINTLKDFKNRYPNLTIILEPGSAFAWQTGALIAKVVDIVEDKNIKTAILNVSFTCHMPDCLEMPYMPKVTGAEILNADEVMEMTPQQKRERHLYRLGGNSCLSGDFMGFWSFDRPLVIGQCITFEDMLHYTMVKTNMFNGISHPSLWVKDLQGQYKLLRKYDYQDYKSRMD